MKRLIVLALLFVLLVGSAGGGKALPARLSGKLAFVRGGALWVKTLPDGQPLQLWDGGVSHPRWSPSGQWLMVRQGEGVRFFLVDKELSPEVLESPAPVWSPREDIVAYVDEEGRLRVTDPFGEKRRVLVAPEQPGAIGGPVWSPDGRWIAYIDSRRGTQTGPASVSIWRVNVDEGQPVRVTEVSTDPHFCLILPGWTPDGESVLYWPVPQCSNSLLADGTQLMAAPARGGASGKLADAMLTHSELLAPSPVAGQLAVAVGGNRMTWTNKQIAVIDPQTGQARKISPGGTAAISPAWSPDGKQVAFVAMPDAGPDVGGGDTARQAMMGRRIWVAAPDGSHARPITGDEQYRDEAPRFTSAGILFARLDRDSKASLWVANGGGATRVTDLDAPTGAWFGYYGWLDWSSVFDWHP